MMDLMFPATYLDDLNRFAHLVWGNPQALLKQLPPHGVEVIDFGEYFKALQSLFAGMLHCGEIVLVRDEYRTALQALETDWLYQRGTYVTGQPGIGKTYFLVYALIHFLGKKQPVALHDLAGGPFYLLFKENVTIHHIKYGIPLDECGFVWALSDSNVDVKIPPAVFRRDPSRIRVIQATSPNASNYKQWSKYHGASCYVMDIWTEEEVENLATLLGLDVGRMVTLARKWGTVPRTLLDYMDREDQWVEYLYHDRAQRAAKKSAVMMSAGLQLDLPADAPSLFYFIRPKKTDTGDVDREFPTITVPTQTLRELLEEGLRG